MIKKIDNNQKSRKTSGGFEIEILYPGNILLETADTGIGTIGRIDQAKVTPGTLVPMHPHKDDEILTYLRSGTVKHTDSEGTTENISNTRLMMMNAGKSFFHEELTLQDSDMLEGLQIFIRPEEKDLQPQVQFHDFSDAYSINAWRLIAGEDKATCPLHIRSKTWIYDMRLDIGKKEAYLPQIHNDFSTCLFYVFEGKVKINDDIVLSKGESIIIKDEEIKVKALQTSDIVLFETDGDSKYYDGGMYSGNAYRV